MAGVNPFWSERVQEEMRLREARPEGFPPVPESGDEEEVARAPVRAAQEDTAAQRKGTGHCRRSRRTWRRTEAVRR